MDPASDETTLRHQVRRPTSDVQRPECLRLYEGLQQHSRWNRVALTKHEVTCGKELVQLLRHTDAPLTLAPCYSDGCNLRKTATDMGHHETTLTLPPACCSQKGKGGEQKHQPPRKRLPPQGQALALPLQPLP